MTRWIMIALIGVFMMVAPVHASSITAYLEVILSDSGQLIDGPTDVTLSLFGPDQDLRWREVHRDTLFFNGSAVFQIGTMSEIKTYSFYDRGVKLMLSIGSESVELPMYSTPFSLFSHAADVVNAIHMEGVFHSDLINRRIGINIDVPTPSVQLEVNGAMRVGDHSDPDYNVIGAIRWRNNRLEGHHNEKWKLLDLGPSDGLESKWESNDPLEFFYFNGISGVNSFVSPPLVSIATTNSLATLTVSGDVYIEESIGIGGALSSPGRLNLTDHYGVSLNSSIYARSIVIDQDNVFNFTDGLKVSGQLIGDGSGITHIGSENLSNDSIQSEEIANQAIHSTQIVDDAVTNSKIQLGSIFRQHIKPGFKLSNDYYHSFIVTNNKVQRASIHEDDFSDDFELMVFHFMDGSIVSRNIDAAQIDAIKIMDDSLRLVKFKAAFMDNASILEDDIVRDTNIENNTILAEDFSPGALSYDHLSSVVSIEKGGTNQTSYGSVLGELLVVSNNQFVSVPQFVLSDTGLGVGTTVPNARLDIRQRDDDRPIRVWSNQASSTGVQLKNVVSDWFVGMTPDSNFEIMLMDDSSGASVSRSLLKMDRQSGHVGILVEPNVTGERLTIGGGLLLGDKHPLVTVSDLKPGGIYYSTSDHQFKFKTANGVVSPTLGPPDGGVSFTAHEESFYVANVDNSSLRSRVLLSDTLQLFGKNHHVVGGFSSVVDGQDHFMKQSHSSSISGRSLNVNFLINSHFMGHDLFGHFVNSSTVLGRQHSVSFMDQSILHGDQHVLSHASDVNVYGTSHQLGFTRSSTISGESNDVRMSRQMMVLGDQHMIDFSMGTSVYGQDHSLSHVASSVVDGRGNRVQYADRSIVVGQDNHVQMANGVTVVGHQNHIMNANGTYVGSNNRHYGLGDPIVMGNHNVLLGKHHGIIHSNALVSIGTASMNIHEDSSIVFHAPGGVDIVSGNMTLAHLASNGGSWAHVSDQSLKVNIEPLDPEEILAKVMALPIMEWTYKGQAYVQHIGPMAQDFYDMFRLGRDKRYIQSVDMDGVIFSSIQGLSKVMTRVEHEYALFKEQESKIKQSLDVVLDQLDTLSVSGNQLIKANDELNQQFEGLHNRERLQLESINDLNQKIDHLKQQIEGRL